MTQLMPNFEEKTTKETVFLEDEELEEGDLPANFECDYSYIFLVDRSGSMRGNRMEITKEAMKLFMKSIPPDSEFTIISFGTRHEFFKKKP